MRGNSPTNSSNLHQIGSPNVDSLDALASVESYNTPRVIRAANASDHLNTSATSAETALPDSSTVLRGLETSPQASSSHPHDPAASESESRDIDRPSTSGSTVGAGRPLIGSSIASQPRVDIESVPNRSYVTLEETLAPSTGTWTASQYSHLSTRDIVQQALDSLSQTMAPNEDYNFDVGTSIAMEGAEAVVENINHVFAQYDAGGSSCLSEVNQEGPPPQ